MLQHRNKEKDMFARQRRSIAAGWATGCVLLCSQGITLAQPTPPTPPGQRDVSPLDSKKSQAEEAYSRGAYPTTIQLADEVLRQAPNDHVALYLRGSARVELGLQRNDSDMLRAGIADSREAIRLGGSESSMYYLPYLYGMTKLSLIEQRDDHASVSVQVADQALANQNLKPDEKANLIYQRGLANNALRKHDNAVSDFEAAIRLNPKLLAAYVAAADTLGVQDKADRARVAFNRAVQAFSDNPLIYNNRGMYLQKLDRYDEAVADFTRAIELDGNYYFAYVNRGFTLLKKDDLQAADADFTQALRMRDDQAMVYGFRGTTRMRQGRTQEAIADYNKAVQLAPTSAVAHTDLAFTNYFAGDYAQALKEFNKAVELNPGFRELDPWRVACHEELKQEQQAQTQFAPELSKPAKDWTWIEALLAFQLGRIDPTQLRATVSKSEPQRTPQLCEAEYFIGRKAMRSGNAQEASQAFRRAMQTGAKHLSAYRGAEIALRR